MVDSLSVTSNLFRQNIIESSQISLLLEEQARQGLFILLYSTNLVLIIKDCMISADHYFKDSIREINSALKN